MNEEEIENKIINHYKKIKEMDFGKPKAEFVSFKIVIYNNSIKLDFDEFSNEKIEKYIEIFKYYKKRVNRVLTDFHKLKDRKNLRAIIQLANKRIEKLEKIIETRKNEYLEREQIKLENKKFNWQKIGAISSIILSLIALGISLAALLINL